MALNEIMRSSGTRVYSGDGFEDRFNGKNGPGRVGESSEALLTPMERIRTLTSRRSPNPAGKLEARAWTPNNREYTHSASELIGQIAMTKIPAAWIVGYADAGRVSGIHADITVPANGGVILAPRHQPTLLEINVLADSPPDIKRLLRGYIHHFRTEGKWPVRPGATTIQTRWYYEVAEGIIKDPFSDTAIQLLAWINNGQPLRGESFLSVLTRQVLEAVARKDEAFQEKFLRRLKSRHHTLFDDRIRV